MTIAQQVAKVSANIESAGRVSEFVQAVRFLMIGRADKSDPERLAQNARTASRVVEFVKSPAAAGSMTGWGSPLSPFQNLATAFLQSLSAISVFDALWPSMVQSPLRQTVIAVSSVLTGSGVSEGSVKPASKLSLTANDLDVAKCAAFCAISIEALRSGSPEALALLQRELRRTISRASNSIFVPILTASAPSFPSSGIQASGVRQDLRTLLSAVSSGADSRLYLITTRKIVEAWSVLPDTAGAAAFPGVTVNGGEVAGMQIIPCDECVDGEITLIDATQVAAGTEGLTLDVTTEASIQMDAAPDSPPSASSPYVSLWQLQLVGLRAERYVSAKVLRPDASAKITGASYTGGSPA